MMPLDSKIKPLLNADIAEYTSVVRSKRGSVAENTKTTSTKPTTEKKLKLSSSQSYLSLNRNPFKSTFSST